MKRSYLLAIVALALFVFVGAAGAARPCGKAAIEDWYDNGTFDRSWDCACLHDAIDRLPASQPSYSSVKQDFQQQLARQSCGIAQIEGTLTPVATAGGTDKSLSGGDDPWAFIIVGGLTLGLVALIFLAVHRQRRRRA